MLIEAFYRLKNYAKNRKAEINKLHFQSHWKSIPFFDDKPALNRLSKTL